MKVRADRDLCMGSGLCAFLAPNTFDVDDEAKVAVLDGDDPDDKVRAAVESCPQGALFLAEPAGDHGSRQAARPADSQLAGEAP